jgi:hypothetical protein
MKKSEKFQWTNEADQEFKELKRVLSTPPVLVAPNEKRTAAAIHRYYQPGDQHSLGRRTTRERKNSARPATSILPKQFTLTFQATIPSLSEASIWCLYDSKETAILLFGTPDRSSQ